MTTSFYRTGPLAVCTTCGLVLHRIGGGWREKVYWSLAAGGKSKPIYRSSRCMTRDEAAKHMEGKLTHSEATLIAHRGDHTVSTEPDVLLLAQLAGLTDGRCMTDD